MRYESELEPLLLMQLEVLKRKEQYSIASTLVNETILVYSVIFIKVYTFGNP